MASSLQSTTSTVRLKACASCHGIGIYLLIFPILCALAIIALVVIIQITQGQDDQKHSIKKQTAKNSQDNSSTLNVYLEPSVDVLGVANGGVRNEDLSRVNTNKLSEEEGLLAWLLSRDGEESTRVNQTELLEAKKQFLRWAPHLKYIESIKYLKNNQDLLRQLKENIIKLENIQNVTELQKVKNRTNVFNDALIMNQDRAVIGGDDGIIIKRKSVSRIPAKAKSAYKHAKPIVPRCVHVIWFRANNSNACLFRFHNFISIYSVHRFIKPDFIYVWHNSTPCGPWWHEATSRIPNIILREYLAPATVFGQPIKIIEHQSDVARINIILKHGGIYMDLDVVALRSWDPLLHYEATMGAETPNLLGSGVVIAAPQSRFIALWLESYKVFKDNKWNYNSCEVPSKISRRYPELVHIEWETIHRPAWNEVDWLYSEGKLWDWSSNYCIHLWYRYHASEHSPEDIRKINTTMAEIFRYVYYGSTDML